MNREEMLAIIRSQMSEKRYIHTLGVLESALDLARRYGANEGKAEVAAIFHDYAKFRDAAEMETIIQKRADIPNDLLEFHKELWHAPVGAYLVEKEVGIIDGEILDAIRFHTTGRVGMTLLDKVIYLADCIEPGRNFPKVEEIRKQAQSDINQALASAMVSTISFLEKQGQKVYPLTIDAYRDLKRTGYNDRKEREQYS